MWENIPPSQPGLRCKILVEMMARIARKALFARFRQVIGASADTYHLVAAEFLTQLLWPAPQHPPHSAGGLNSGNAHTSLNASSASVAPLQVQGDFWDLTIQRGVQQYFEMAAPHELDTRSFLLGPERSQYVWLLIERLQELTGMKIRDDALERLRLSRFDLPVLASVSGGLTFPPLNSPQMARSVSSSNVAGTTDRFTRTSSAVSPSAAHAHAHTRFSDGGPVSPRSSTGSMALPATPAPSPAASSSGIPLLTSSSSAQLPLTRVEPEHIESISILDKPMVIAPFGYQGTADSINEAEEFYLQELAQREDALYVSFPLPFIFVCFSILCVFFYFVCVKSRCQYRHFHICERATEEIFTARVMFFFSIMWVVCVYKCIG